MFSPDPSRTQSLRPKRTRQAAGAEDSIKLPQAKRKRSALRRDTFEPLAEASINEVAGREATEEKSNGRVATTAPTKELTLRGTKKPEKRSERATNSNSGLTLSSNDFYTVSQLPALPDQIRNRPSIPYSCVVSPEHGYALALTHNDAILWPYNSSTSTPPPKDVVTFKLPFPPASVDDPLPLATFTAKSASGEPGIVVVSAKWGKIVYWEMLSNASSFIPGQTSSVQGSVPGMMTGEVIEELVNAEPSGFILTFRQGRVAHLTIRDQMGRPGIGVQFLRKYSNGSVGIFGSIRNVFGADRRKGIPIVKAGGSRKGQRDVVIACEDAELEFWNTNLSVGNSLETAFSFKDEVLEALKDTIHDASTFKILDVELSAGPTVSMSRRNSHGAPMMVLASTTSEHETKFFIIEMIIDQGAKVRAVHPISCYSCPASDSTSWRPRLCVAKSQPIAFILFETALVLFSLAKIRESPSSQLLMERKAPPEPLQDCIRFQDGTIYKMLGFALEASEKQTSLVFGVQGFGMIKLTSRLRENEEIDVDELEDRITAKSKIEQAVFFGNIKQNPLDLKSVRESFTAEEIESAALAISSEILSSTSSHLPKSAPSIDMQMRLRAKALDDLAQHVLEHYASAIPRNTRFILLLNAEKLAAAQALWKVQEEVQRRYPLSDREMPYLDFVLRALHESRQKYPNPEKGEKDRVRHWLINSVANIDHLVSELVDCTSELEAMDVTNPQVVADYLKEAVDLWNASFTAAFKFREDNSPLYGLGDEVFEDGILVTGFPVEIPWPWTSKPEPFKYAQRLVFDVCKFLNEWWELSHGREKKKKMPTDMDGKPYEAPSVVALKALVNRLPVEVELFARVAREEVIQAECHLRRVEKDPEALKEEITNIRQEKRDRLSHALELISNFTMPGAIRLAEKLQYYEDLVSLHYDCYNRLTMEAERDPSLADINREKIEEMQTRAEEYFEEFGKGWVFAYFSQLVIDGECGSLLAKGQEDRDKERFLTWFFRAATEKSGQNVGKISWIHDVISESDYRGAEKTLHAVAVEEKSDVWNKKTELALAKLAALAADEGGQSRNLRPYDDGLALLDIQNQVYDHVMASVGPALDEKAAQDLAMEIFASRTMGKLPGLKRRVKQLLKALVRATPLNAEELVELLTLMDPVEFVGSPDADPEVNGQEFSLALKVVDISALPTSQQDDLRTLIWRRAMLRDDWLALNDTSGKDDRQVEQEMQQSGLFRTLQNAFLLEQLDDVPVHLVSPSEILGRDAFPSSLQDRYAENEVESIRRDVEKEQARLRTFVEKGRLEDHFGGLVASAQRAVRSMVDAQGEEMAEQVLEENDGLV